MNETLGALSCSHEAPVVPPEVAGTSLRTFGAVSLSETLSHTTALVSTVSPSFRTVFIVDAKMFAMKAFGWHKFWFPKMVTHDLFPSFSAFWSG